MFPVPVPLFAVSLPHRIIVESPNPSEESLSTTRTRVHSNRLRECSFCCLHLSPSPLKRTASERGNTGRCPSPAGHPAAAPTARHRGTRIQTDNDQAEDRERGGERGRTGARLRKSRWTTGGDSRRDTARPIRGPLFGMDGDRRGGADRRQKLTRRQ